MGILVEHHDDDKTPREHESTRGRRLKRDRHISETERASIIWVVSGQRMFQLSLAQKRPCQSRPVKCLETAFEKRGRLGRSRVLFMIRSFLVRFLSHLSPDRQELGSVNTGHSLPTMSAEEHRDRDLHKVKLISH